MIARYTRPEMAGVFSDARRYAVWLEIEILSAEGWERLGRVPKGTGARLRRRAKAPAPSRVEAIEQKTRHDVIAFLTAVGDSAGDDARHLHLGLTSSDLVDTALAVVIRDAGTILLAKLDSFRASVASLARRHRRTLQIGRTHGIHAEPITFGLKAAVWHGEIVRARERIVAALRETAVGKMSGAVGTFGNLDPRVEAYVLTKLGLAAEPVATQVVQRDRHAALLSSLALLGASLERIATELRNLQHTEIREVEEPFGAGQKGSSAMPHKRNPVTLEQVCGLARVLRGNAMAAMENVALWHERDISHSSVERVIVPDSFVLAHYMLFRMEDVVSNLNVDAARMRANLEMTGGLVFSGEVLLKLTQAGLARDRAYEVVQRHAMEAWRGGSSFRERLGGDPEVSRRLGTKDLLACFDPERSLRHVDMLFARAGLDGKQGGGKR